MNQTSRDSCPAFVVFAFLFGLAQIFDHPFTTATIFDFSSKDTFKGIIGACTSISAVWVMLRPSSIYRSIALYVFVVLMTISALPRSPNHVVFQALVLISIITAFIYAKIKDKNLTNRSFYELIVPIVRIEVICLYFWAAFHKLNTGFFNENISCATIQIFNIKDAISIFPSYDWFISINPYLTLLTESLIPILLVIPRTRIVGLVVAFIFHFILGFRYTGFTILTYSLLSLFIPAACYEQIKPKFDEFKDRFSRFTLKFSNYVNWNKTVFDKYIFQIIYLIIFLVVVGFILRGNPNKIYMLSREGLYLLVCFIITIFITYFIIRDMKTNRIDDKINLNPSVKWLLIFPLIIFINGMLPHLGVKNIQSMAMFSNLRTEGGTTNHLIIPSSFQIFNNLEDLVTIKGANKPILNKFSGYTSRSPQRGTSVTLPRSYMSYMTKNKRDFEKRFEYRIPYPLFQSMITQLKERGEDNIRVHYERGGEEFYVRNAETDPELSSVSIIKIKLLDQRAVPDDERGLCMW